MRQTFLVVFVALLATFSVARPEEKARVLAPEALKMLMDGNARFVSGEAPGPHRGPARRAEVAKGQAPFAVVVACSDSRVAPEFVFDQGLGDLFVTRVAGNTIDTVAVGSIEYGVEHLGA